MMLGVEVTASETGNEVVTGAFVTRDAPARPNA